MSHERVKPITQKYVITGMSIMNNLFLITNYDGNDPDQSLNGAGQNGLGLDYFQNPSVRTIRIALNLTL